MSSGFSRARLMGAHEMGQSSNTNYYGMNTYESCSIDTAGGDAASLIQCIAQSFEAQQQTRDDDLLEWLLVICGALIFFMQAGFAMLCAGCVRKKNVQNTMLKNLLDACGASLAFFSIGYAFAFGGENETDDITFIGSKNFFAMGNISSGFWFFEYAFSATCVTIVAGTLAERCQMAAYLCYSIFLTGFVYPIVAHSIWSRNGFLSAFSVDPYRGVGAIDFAGSGVVHLTGGTTALIATYILGARKGRFHDNRGRLLPTPRVIHGHSIALQLMGTMVLWFSWYGFNPGAALLLNVQETGKVAARAAVNTSLSAAAGACSSLFINLYIQERKTGEYKFDLSRAMNGTLSALVATTAGCGTIENWAALLVGWVAGMLYLGASNLLVSVRLDDAVDAIPVHMVNGLWGMLVVGLFSSPGGMQEAFNDNEHVGWFYSLGRGSLDATLLGNQCLAALFIMGWTFVCMCPFFIWLNFMGWFRADSLEELVGLDLSYMGHRHNLIDNGDDFSDVGSVQGTDEDDEPKKEPDMEQAKVLAKASGYVQNPDAMSDLSGPI